ncbi:hypothetical protein H6G89_13685 [Oscillatoria sp. FACHB-1407]|uniref:hypothetical protein n=1 Tax=Oscillatoria sp. FACHB-1407 TaxID=2692847 RepID=UPI001681DA1A|nr:hypothetical protein [Oscillatoria sp. FACHB-1407]MBD2462099.1 hypothetical protein [Oscillatoria sp. FACHB-1407]
MYFAEFTLPGTMELVNELVIHAASEAIATQFAQEYASHWEFELFALTVATEQQVRFCRLTGNAVAIA